MTPTKRSGADTRNSKVEIQSSPADGCPLAPFKPLPIGRKSAVTLLLTTQAPSSLAAGDAIVTGDVLFVDPNEIKGVQGQLAYRDITGVGSWQPGDPIWVDTNGDSILYNTREQVIYAQSIRKQARRFNFPTTWARRMDSTSATISPRVIPANGIPQMII